MTHFEILPVWIAIPVAILVFFGGALTLIGAIGLWRLPSFYDRLHAPTLGTSWGTAGIVLASIIMFSVAGGRAVIHESAISIFIMVTTPVTLMLLGRAALHRDRVEGNVPFQFTREDEVDAKAAQQLAQAEARANIIRAQEASLAAEKAALEPELSEPVVADAVAPEEIAKAAGAETSHPAPALPDAAGELPPTISDETLDEDAEFFPEPDADTPPAETSADTVESGEDSPVAAAPTKPDDDKAGAADKGDDEKPAPLPEY